MPRPIEALVHRDALAANLDARAAPRPARGSGRWSRPTPTATASPTSIPALQRRRRLRAARHRRGRALRELGWRGPILLLEGCFDARDLETCSRLNLWHVVHHAAPDRLAGRAQDRPAAARLPEAEQRHEPARLRARALPRRVAAPRRAAAGRRDHADDAPRRRRRRRRRRRSSRRSPRSTRRPHDLPGERSLCNSAATLRFGARLAAGGADWVRPGIMLYGSSPDHPLHSAADWGLAPAMTLRTAADRGAGARAPARASATAAASPPSAPMRIGVVACGYADGYPRLAPGGNERGTPVLVDGVRTRTVGRVSMDMITVDLTPVPAARSAARSRCGAAPTTARCCRSTRSPSAAGTVGYELMCARAPRVPVRGRLSADALPLPPRRSRRRGRGRDHRGPRPGRGRPERQQGVERGAPALRRRRLVAARGGQGAPARRAPTGASATKAWSSSRRSAIAART